MHCSIIGINRKTDAAGNPIISASRKLPWLQDTPEADVWSKWNVTYRDVMIVDGAGELVGVFNLSSHDLGNGDNWNMLTKMITDASVLPDSDNDKLSDLWEMAEFGNLETASSTSSADVIAYAYGQGKSRRAPALALDVVSGDGGVYAEIELVARSGSAAGLVYGIEISQDGVNWVPLEMKQTNRDPFYDGTALQVLKLRSSSPIDGSIGLVRGWAGFSPQ